MEKQKADGECKVFNKQWQDKYLFTDRTCIAVSYLYIQDL